MLLPERLFRDVGSAAAGFVKRLAEEYGTGRDSELEVLWTKAWNGIGKSKSQAYGLDGPLTEAMNHPAGKLAEAALIRLRKFEPGRGAGLPLPVRSYFDKISVGVDGHLGRVMLATKLHYLFAIDPAWVGEQLIPRLNPRFSEEAADLWFAYGWSPTIGPDLLQAFKDSYLEVLCGREEGGRTRSNLIHLFVTICLEAPSELTTEEVHRVVQAMSEKALKIVLGSLKQRLRGDPAARARIWHEKIHPWLHDYWPRAVVRNTGGTSEAMVALLPECGDAFADAAAWSLHYLRPLEGHGLYHLHKNGCAEQHPGSMLLVLDKVATADALPGHQRHTLHMILDVLDAADPDSSGDVRFQRLYQIATG